MLPSSARRSNERYGFRDGRIHALESFCVRLSVPYSQELQHIKRIERNCFAVEKQRGVGQRRPPMVSTVCAGPEWPRGGKHRP